MTNHYTPVETGFEQKSLRCVIENWLYNPDTKVLFMSSFELRRRLMKAFRRPDWAQPTR